MNGAGLGFAALEALSLRDRSSVLNIAATLNDGLEVKAVVCLGTSDNLGSPRISVLRTHRGEPRAKPWAYCSLGTSA